MVTKKESKNKTENKENIMSMSIACTQINLHLYDTDVNLSMYFKVICFRATSGVTLSVLFFLSETGCLCMSLCACE